jgi:hypothetical protein
VACEQPPPPLLGGPDGPAPVIDSCADAGETIASATVPKVNRNLRSSRILVSMAPGPERPDAAKGDQRSPDAMDLRLDIRVIRFPGEQCGEDAGTVGKSLHQGC